jgi:hypothetical protein
MTTPAVHAFKEWSAIVDALGAGVQTIILRKGGISEGRGGFEPARAGRFWLFPTRFHAQREKLKPAAAPFCDAADTQGEAEGQPLRAFHFYADLVSHRFLTDWNEVAGFNAHHLWTEATVRERFEWAKPAGVHLLCVRVHRLAEALALPAGPDLGGCKSWVELPPDLTPDNRLSTPVLEDATFARTRATLGF